MRNITDPTSPPVAECKNGLAANVISSFDDLAHSKAFFLIEDTRGKQSLGGDVYASSRIALKNLFLINEPLAETADGRPRLVLMARTVECTEKDFNGSSCDSTWMKLPLASGLSSEPSGELLQDTSIGF